MAAGLGRLGAQFPADCADQQSVKRSSFEMCEVEGGSVSWDAEVIHRLSGAQQQHLIGV